MARNLCICLLVAGLAALAGARKLHASEAGGVSVIQAADASGASSLQHATSTADASGAIDVASRGRRIEILMAVMSRCPDARWVCTMLIGAVGCEIPASCMASNPPKKPLVTMFSPGSLAQGGGGHHGRGAGQVGVMREMAESDSTPWVVGFAPGLSACEDACGTVLN